MNQERGTLASLISAWGNGHSTIGVYRVALTYRSRDPRSWVADMNAETTRRIAVVEVAHGSSHSETVERLERDYSTKEYPAVFRARRIAGY